MLSKTIRNERSKEEEEEEVSLEKVLFFFYFYFQKRLLQLQGPQPLSYVDISFGGPYLCGPPGQDL